MSNQMVAKPLVANCHTAHLPLTFTSWKQNTTSYQKQTFVKVDQQKKMRMNFGAK